MSVNSPSPYAAEISICRFKTQRTTRPKIMFLMYCLIQLGSVAPGSESGSSTSSTVSIDLRTGGRVIPVSYLGAHASDNLRVLEREQLAARRFPSHGLENGALLRHFLPNHLPSNRRISGGKTINVPNLHWWGGIQARGKERDDSESAPYRYRSTDFWQLLDFTAERGCQSLVVTPGFPLQTKETAMAAVAFCNGSPEDTRLIGMDRFGEDWKTVGHWASIRAKGDDLHSPHPQPYNVKLWELGNEYYYPSLPHCGRNWLTIEGYGNNKKDHNNAKRAFFFMHGRNIDGVNHEGYITFIKHMKMVDPTILVAPMLAPETTAMQYADWNEVILSEGKGTYDFLTYHGYVRSNGLSTDDFLRQPWKSGAPLAVAIKKRMAEHGVGDVPLINSEWHPYEPIELGSIQMSTALYVANSIGMFLECGIAGQCFYGPYDTRHANGGSWATLVRSPEADVKWGLPAGYRLPSYYAFALWRGVEKFLVPIDRTLSPNGGISLYSMANESRDRVNIIAINATPSQHAVAINFTGTMSAGKLFIHEVVPANGTPNDMHVLFNDLAMSAPENRGVDDLRAIKSSRQLNIVNSRVVAELRPWSMNRADVRFDQVK